jgi:amino acid permease
MTSPSSKDSNGQLAQGFKPRHVTMLSIAGIIGAGLFVGSGHAIAAAGPAVLLAYLFSGLLVVLVMRMLGEMAVANPDTGSFSTYADQAIGRWAGFTIGWLYWWFWVLVIPIEALAAGHVLNQWFPQVDAWLFALASIIALVITNLFSVSKYGEGGGDHRFHRRGFCRVDGLGARSAGQRPERPDGRTRRVRPQRSVGGGGRLHHHHVQLHRDGGCDHRRR